MAKIIHLKDYDTKIKKIKLTTAQLKFFTHPEYNLSKNCRNPKVYELCHRCGACGRRFDENGKLI